MKCLRTISLIGVLYRWISFFKILYLFNLDWWKMSMICIVDKLISVEVKYNYFKIHAIKKYYEMIEWRIHNFSKCFPPCPIPL